MVCQGRDRRRRDRADRPSSPTSPTSPPAGCASARARRRSGSWTHALDRAAPCPGEGFKRGFVLAVYSQKFFGGLAELSSASIHIGNAIREVYADFEARARQPSGPGAGGRLHRLGADEGPLRHQLPATLEIVKWVERPAELPDPEPGRAVGYLAGRAGCDRPAAGQHVPPPQPAARAARSPDRGRVLTRGADRRPASFGPIRVHDNVRPILEPDAGQMLRHVEHLFGGGLDGCHEGKIELAWTDGRDGRLAMPTCSAPISWTDLVERAARENRIRARTSISARRCANPTSPPSALQR